MSLESYLEDLENETTSRGVKLDLRDTTYLRIEGIAVEGYFCEDTPALVTSVKKPQKLWLPVLVHEHCHMDQWIEKDPSYTETWMKDEKLCAIDIFDRWIKGEDFSEEIVKRTAKLNRDIELNCERRALKKIKKYDLPINPEEYVRSAAANVHHYNYILKRRKMAGKPGFPCYNDNKILETMPITLRGNFNRITNKQLEAFEEFNNRIKSLVQ